MEKQQIMMEDLNVFKKGNLGVKGYEILFQALVEKTLEANGFTECWWQALNHEDIFMKLWSIYKIEDTLGNSIIFNIQEYYNKIKKMTDDYIGKKLCE